MDVAFAAPAWAWPRARGRAQRSAQPAWGPRTCCLMCPDAGTAQWKQFNGVLRRVFRTKGVTAAVNTLVGNEESTPENFNQVVTLLRDEGLHHAALSLAHDAVQVDKADSLTLRLAMKACMELGDHEAARRTMSTARAIDLPIEPSLARSFLRVIGNALGADAARDEFDKLALRDESAAASLEAMVEIYVRADRTPDALKLLEDNPECNPSVRVYNTLLAGAGRCSSDHIDAVLALMGAKKVTADVATYNTILSAFHRSGESDKVEGLWSAMQEQATPPNVTSYNIMINSCAERGEPERAMDLFADMQDQELRPDRVTFTTLIKAFGSARKPDRSVELLRHMRESSVGADAQAYNATLHSCLGCGQASVAMELLRDMIEEGLPVRPHFWSWLLETCVARSDEARGLKVLAMMEHRRLKPSPSSIMKMRIEMEALGGFHILPDKLQEIEEDDDDEL